METFQYSDAPVKVVESSYIWKIPNYSFNCPTIYSTSFIVDGKIKV